MADTKISGLTAASALDGTEEFAVNQGGTSKKATAAQIAASGPAWTAYTPTFTAASGNPTLGSFAITGRYGQRGKTVSFSVVITATAASGYGSGSYSFGLPVAARNADEVVVTAAQTGPNHTYTGRSSGGSTTIVTLMLNATDVAMNGTNSGMATGTVLRIVGTYEAA